MSDQSAQLASIVERVQRLQAEKREIEDDIKEVYAEARSAGYDVKILRAVVKHLGKDADDVAEFETLFDLYLEEVKRGLAPASRATHASAIPMPSGAEAGSAVRAGAPILTAAE